MNYKKPMITYFLLLVKKMVVIMTIIVNLYSYKYNKPTLVYENKLTVSE